MNHKRKIINSIRRKEQNCLPSQIDYTPEMAKKIERLLKIEATEIDKVLDNHIRYYTFDDKIKKDENNGIIYDIWGVGWDIVLTEGFHFRFHPLINSENLTNYIFPEPSESILKSLKSIDKGEQKEFFILFDQGWTLFERCWMLRGFENFLSDLHFRTKEVRYLLDGITEFHLEIADKIIKLGIIDGVYTGDDVGTQRGMLISPSTWRDFFQMGYKKIWTKYKDKGLSIFHHSCGNIMEILPDLVEIGLDVLTPIQPEAMDPQILSKEFSKSLSFMGGISTQRTLPYGTPEDVDKETLKMIRVLGGNNGYIISPSHEITSDCRDENFLALIKAVKKYKNKQII